MTRRPRIGVLTSQDARDPVPVSGTPYHMARALERHAGEVVYLDTGIPIAYASDVMFALMRSSRSLFEARLNWDHWGRRMADIVSALD